MKVSPRMVSAVVFGVSTFLLAGFVRSAVQQQKQVSKKLGKQAVQEWEGEGGNIVDAAPRSTVG